jgi:hypothetical protein
MDSRKSDLFITTLLEPMGLALLGSFIPVGADNVPDLKDGRSARRLLLIGNGGSSFWQKFSHSPEYRDNNPDPLDRWSRRTGMQLARKLGGIALFPFDGPPYLPFQSWAKKTAQIAPSRISMVMHARFGLWHAYRFALALPDLQTGSAQGQIFTSPCMDCEDQPCLKACPVDAFSGDGFGAGQCIKYLAQDAETTCRRLGCEARRSCPVGKDFIYQPSHAQFHMDAFVRSQRG